MKILLLNNIPIISSIFIYMLLIILCLIQAYKNPLTPTISIHNIKIWFYKTVTLTETKKITRTSDLFKHYCSYVQITNNSHKDLILFGKMFKSFILEENIPLVYKKGTYAGYTNIKGLL